MKYKKIIFSLLLIIFLMCTSTVSATISIPDTITINASDLYYLEGTNYLPASTTLRFSHKKDSTGARVYCTEADETMFSSGSQVYTKGRKLGNQTMFVLISASGDTTDKDYFATGLAVWYTIDSNSIHLSNFDKETDGSLKGTYKGYSNDTTQRVKTLANGSLSYTYKDPSITASPKNVTLTLSSDESNYVSPELGVTTTGYVSDYTVTLTGAPTGTKIIDTNGSEKSTFATNAKFKISVPAANVETGNTEITINIKATGTEYAAYEYVSTSYQNVAKLFKGTINLNASITATLYNAPKDHIYISKQDATTGEELPDAELVLKDSKGNVIDSWKSGITPHKVEKVLAAGKYTLSETMAPEGYEKTTETVTFTVKEDGTVDKQVIMYNKPKEVPYSPPTGTSTFMFILMGSFVLFAIAFYYYAGYKVKKQM